MTEAMTTQARLLTVGQLQESASGAALHFQEGGQGRLSAADGEYAVNMRLARRSRERQHPLGVSFGEGQAIATLARADNDIPSRLWEVAGDDAHVLFQGHDGEFRLKRDHPEFARLRLLLDEAIAHKARVWFIAQTPDLFLLDVLPAAEASPAPKSPVDSLAAIQNQPV